MEWKINRRYSQMCGHGEAEYIVELSLDGCPCKILITDGCNEEAQKKTVDYVLKALNG